MVPKCSKRERANRAHDFRESIESWRAQATSAVDHILADQRKFIFSNRFAGGFVVGNSRKSACGHLRIHEAGTANADPRETIIASSDHCSDTAVMPEYLLCRR
mmetsp:Transcript_20247/g.63639  ORF Transcript_20247/g.63639 Transcript_20247/m.63639 type:complete len:103 (-) Transcript_20247:530-838(-)